MTRRDVLQLFAMLLPACSDRKDSNVVDHVPIPITITLGESIFAVAARTPGIIDIAVMVDNAPAMVDRSLQISVVVDGQSFPLPPTLFAAIEQMAGVVTGVATAPMRRFADLAQCRELAIDLVREAARRGWTVTQRWPMELAMMQAHLAEPNRDRYTKSVALLHRGDAELEVYLKETSGAELEGRNPPARGNLFLVNTDFRVPRLEDEQTKRVFDRREQLTGGTSSVPLSAWAPNAGR